MSAEIIASWAVMERLYDRLGTKAARGLDVDTAVVLTQCVEALEESLGSVSDPPKGGDAT